MTSRAIIVAMLSGALCAAGGVAGGYFLADRELTPQQVQRNVYKAIGDERRQHRQDCALSSGFGDDGC